MNICHFFNLFNLEEILKYNVEIYQVIPYTKNFQFNKLNATLGQNVTHIK